MSYMSDPTILPRVREYLESNTNEMYIDLNVLADDLQRKYREYNKRKRSAFRASVNKAYSILLGKCGLDNNSKDLKYKTPTKNVNREIDIETPRVASRDVSFEFSNSKLSNRGLESVMNKQLSNLYASSPSKNAESNNLIDISSDESEQVSKGVNDTFRKKRKRETTTVTPAKPTKKKKSPVVVTEKVTCDFKSIAGLDKTLAELCKIILPMRHPIVCKTIGISPARGLLLHGPPGCGKTLLARAIAGELKVPLLKVAAPELVAGISGESEERIRNLFEQAVETAPCVLFMDEIDAITPSRHNVQKEMERRIVAQLLSCLDDLNENGHSVLVIGATNSLDTIDSALRRPGRFDREISLGIPDANSRVDILKLLASNFKLVENFNYEALASNTPGYVGADLLSLTREAAMVAVNRAFKEIENYKSANVVDTSGAPPIEIDINNTNPDVNCIDTQVPDKVIESTKTEHEFKTLLKEMLTRLHNDTILQGCEENFFQNLRITMSDFEEALKHVQPYAKREGFATVPGITWNDIGSLRDIREELQMAIVAPVRHAKEFHALGINIPAGVLLCGPPGCGKTLLAKAVANEAGINFISVKGPELLNMYVGESERAVRVCFERARNSSPCVIFFDELDALCPKRSDSGEGSASRVVNQMLTEMDGIEGRQGVFLLAASNRPDIIDPAVLRPGRLDKVLFVDLPSASDRVDILKAITKNGTVPRLSVDVSLEEIGKSEQCKGFTGADLAALVRESSIMALKESMLLGGDSLAPVIVRNDHFLEAFSKIRPSVSDKDSKHYEKLRRIYSSSSKYTEVEEMEYS